MSAIPPLEQAIAPQGNPPEGSFPPLTGSEKSAIHFPQYEEAITGILPELWAKIFVEAPLETQIALSRIAKQFYVISKPIIRQTIIAKYAFGKAQWERFFGDIGVEPAWPANIEEILNSPCPFWSGKVVRETHLLTLVPKTVAGQPMTLRSLGELVKTPKQGHSSQYKYFWDTALTEFGDKPVEASHWVLMTKDVLPGTRSKSYAEQQKGLNSFYEVAALLDAAIVIFMHHAETGTRIYNDSPWTYTRCQEVCNYRLMVGGFTPAGLDVYYPRGDADYDGVGLAACWKL